MEYNIESNPIELTPEIRAKTSNRMLYEAQSKVIQEKIGDLEAIRSKLGMSQRKISQLLMIDPSTWVRWTKYGDQVPPHIYRALEWYLQLNPEVGKPKAVENIDLKRLQDQNEKLNLKTEALEQAIRNARVGMIMIAISALIMGFAFYRTIKGL